MENVGKKKLDMQKLLAPAALVILYIVFSIFGNNFLTLDTVKNILFFLCYAHINPQAFSRSLG